MQPYPLFLIASNTREPKEQHSDNIALTSRPNQSDHVRGFYTSLCFNQGVNQGDFCSSQEAAFVDDFRGVISQLLELLGTSGLTSQVPHLHHELPCCCHFPARETSAVNIGREAT